ncbi:SAF domain-containing protein [Saccharopolyspora shandongensis]|uniref:SAF domain-containing protein n=1 Tax=Saccharopolyspora shandongensis TaxID=418495 RepID=UPI0033C5307D
MRTDETGRYGSLYRPYHMIGLELCISIVSAAVRGEATGCPAGFRGDVISVAKRALKAGEVLDGEGGYMVHGKLAPAETSLKFGALPMGLASGVKLCNDIPQGGVVGWDDVEVDDSVLAVQLRRELERTMRG